MPNYPNPGIIFTHQTRRSTAEAKRSLRLIRSTVTRCALTNGDYKQIIILIVIFIY